MRTQKTDHIPFFQAGENNLIQLKNIEGIEFHHNQQNYAVAPVHPVKLRHAEKCQIQLYGDKWLYQWL